MQSTHISHTHRSRLVGVAINIIYLLKLMILAPDHNLWRAPICVFPASRRASILKLSQRESKICISPIT